MSVGEAVVGVAACAGARVAITRLMLVDFRSYTMLDLRVDARHVVLVGPNGAGKTNLLEAMSMLAPGRGLRGARLSELARSTPGEGTARAWTVSATATSSGLETQIGVGFLPGNGDGSAAKRAIRVNGIPVANPAQLAERVRLIWLTPLMDGLFVAGPSDRRRFLDRLISGFDPAHARLWTSYESAMRERLSALRAGAQPAWVSALERTMAEAAVALAASRRAGLAAIAHAMQGQRTSAFPRADVAVAGQIEELLASAAAVDVEDRFAGLLLQSRTADAEAGRTGIGPHLTDFVVRHREKGREARVCSTGEQKALLIRLLLTGASLPAPGGLECPVLLLDEVAAHLDESRRRALFAEIDALGVQAWMTGTDRSVFSALDGIAQFHRVTDGHVRQI